MSLWFIKRFTFFFLHNNTISILLLCCCCSLLLVFVDFISYRSFLAQRLDGLKQEDFMNSSFVIERNRDIYML